MTSLDSPYIQIRSLSSRHFLFLYRLTTCFSLTAQEKQYLLSTIADLAAQMKLLLGDYHKWFAKNTEDMTPTLELFAYAKFLWDFVSHGVPIPHLVPESEPESELEPVGPEPAEPDSPEPELEAVASKGNMNSPNLLEPVKKAGKLRRSLMKFRGGSHEKKRQSKEIKHLQAQLDQHPQTPQTAIPEEVSKKQDIPTIEIPKKPEPPKTLEQIEEEKAQHQREKQQLQQLEASMSLLISGSVTAHYERLVFQKRPFKPVGFGNFVDELVRELQSELKYFTPTFERFHSNPQAVAAEAYAKLYGILHRDDLVRVSGIC